MADAVVWKDRLNSERDRLMAEMNRLAREVAEDGDPLDADRGGIGNHMADDASAVFEQENSLSLRYNTQHLLAQVDYALAKVADGSYGTCESCHRPINPERLEARPYATLCIDCQTREERRHH